MNTKRATMVRVPSGVLRWLIPELVRVPEKAWPDVVMRARCAPMAWGERFALLLWLLFVVILTMGLLRHARQTGDVIAGLAVSVLVPVPMTLVVLLPIHWRRLRRGVRAHLKD